MDTSTPTQQQLNLGLQVPTGINALAQSFVLPRLYADVLLDTDVPNLGSRTFSYLIPEALCQTVKPGMLVDVPFGKTPHKLGYVLAVGTEGPQVARPIGYVMGDAPLFNPTYMAWLTQMAEYTGTPLALVMSVALPTALLKQASRKLNAPELRGLKTHRVLVPLQTTAPTPRQQQVLDALWAEQTPVPFTHFIKQLQVTPSTLNRMQAQGLLRIDTAETDSNAITHLMAHGASLPTLTPDQQHVVDAFLAKPTGTTTWLQGVTGSGKTQVYMAIAAATLAKGQSVLMLVPEIALTSQVASRFMATFDNDLLALWHSQLSTGERVDTWWRAHRGHRRLVIGPRSALFLPMDNLGAILIDEAHDASFKQDNPAPRYDARLEAHRLASLLPNCRVLCGSATPDVAHATYAAEQGHTLQLTARFGTAQLAHVNVVDMRQERKLGQTPIVAQVVENALEQTLAEGHQAIVLVNRRGFYTLMTCTACEHTLTCPHCTVALTVHQPTHTVRCHYCGWEVEVPPCCPACGHFDLRQTGVGTQRVTQQLQTRLPNARIVRLDSDVMRHKNGHLIIFQQFAEGKANVLVGTQMVAKGLDVPNVTCVAIIGGDSGLSLPDYMATERTFQLLTQVAGRAGRGQYPGTVWLQTRLPHHPVIQFAVQQDVEGFYRYELAHRQSEGFPPYCQLIRVLVSSLDEAEAQQGITWLTQQLQQQLEQHQQTPWVSWLGPAPCAISKIQDKYRFQVLIKNTGGAAVRQTLTQWMLAARWPKTLTVHLDIDSQSML
jgi:primosomal protein N' (replication factor Y) (superfamily II helicase)